MTTLDRSVEAMSSELKFINFDNLPEHEVQCIRNILNSCSEFKVPFHVNYQQTNEDSYLANEEDEEEGNYDEQEMELHSDNNTISFGVPVVSMINPYPTHIQQAPMYPMANGSFLANPNQIQHLVFVPEMMNGPVDGIADGSSSSLKSRLDNNGQPSGGMVVSSNPYHHIGMFHCAPSSHHPQQYVMHPAAYISTYMTQPPPSVCKPTMAVASGLSMPSAMNTTTYINDHVPISSPHSIPIVTSPLLESVEQRMASAEESVVETNDDDHVEQEDDDEEGGLEHVVVEVPPITVKSFSGSNVEPAFYHNVDVEEYNFLCDDQLETCDSEVIEEVTTVDDEYIDDFPKEVDVIDEGVVQSSEPLINSNRESATEPSQSSYIISHEKSVKESVSDSPGPTKSWASLFKRGGSSKSMKFPVLPPFKNSQSPTYLLPVITPSVPTDSTQLAANRIPTSSVSIVSKSRENANKGKRKETRRNETCKTNGNVKSNGTIEENRQDVTNLGRILLDVVLDYSNTGHMIRGLNNGGNWCYINSIYTNKILQALLVCNPFYNILNSLRVCCAFNDVKTSSPIIDSMVGFVKEFEMTQQLKNPESGWKQGNKRDDCNRLIGHPFEPTCVYDMLSHLKLNAFEGRQEDAEEFLSCLLNGLHDEMAKAMSCSGDPKFEANAGIVDNGVQNKSVTNGGIDCHQDNDSADEESWKVIEPRNKCSITRSTSFSSSPLSEIFCGRIRSAVHASSTSSATLQPFFTLPLDVQAENVKTVSEALHAFVMKESLLDYHCAKTKQEIVASRQITLEELPPVLILHLKRFVYCKDGGCMKVSKRVDFDVNLDLHKDLLSPVVRTKISSRERSYKLVAVVYHCGNEAVKGHYVTDVFHQAGNAWFRTDDGRVTCLPQGKVLNHPINFVPYLFFYRRLDTVQMQQQQNQNNLPSSK